MALCCSIAGVFVPQPLRDNGCCSQVHTPTSYKAQQLCAECLGLLGAVDPARVAITLDPPEALCRTIQELLISLITRHLVRLLRVASHIFVLDATSLAIQVQLHCLLHAVPSMTSNCDVLLCLPSTVKHAKHLLVTQQAFRHEAALQNSALLLMLRQ